ncbi:hypothetical protein [Comamonas sp.]|uniref:hypothetical protein n=1 Tax=Comamonas sp. TaxID=34028 RepID=UPI00258C075C|nr:hypothetical protein [Comamonas sp.]
MTQKKPALTSQTEGAPGEQVPSTQRVFEAVRELRAMEQIATRETVAELTGLKMGIVDDRLRSLVDDGKLKRLLRGIYELVEQFPPPRAISKTVLGNGAVVYDIGDDVITLSPQEARVLAELSLGAAGTAVLIHSTNQHLFLATELAAKVEKLERELKAQKHHGKGDARQMNILLT